MEAHQQSAATSSSRQLGATEKIRGLLLHRSLPVWFVTGLILFLYQLLQLSHTTERVLKAPQQQAQLDTEQRQYKVLCAAMTGQNDYLNHREMKIAESWGKQCDKLIFLGCLENVTWVPHVTIVTQEEDTHEDVARKEFRMWKYLFDHFGEEYDFFFKTDTDTFVIMDNYRKFISKLNPNVPHYFGKQFWVNNKRLKTFVAGSSVSLSRSALRRFGQAVEGEILDSWGKQIEICGEPKWAEMEHAGDRALGDCLWELGIHSMDTRDEENRERFTVIMADEFKENFSWYQGMSFNTDPPFKLDTTVSKEKGKVSKEGIVYKGNRIFSKGKGCCAEDAIAWHRFSPDKFKQTAEFRDGFWHFPLGY